MTSPFTLDQYWVDPSRNQITTTERTIELAPKAMAVLCVLAERAGEVVSHDELMDRVWPGTVVTPNTLQRAIAQLRKALKDNAKQQKVIATHAKSGYSLVVAVEFTDKPLVLSKKRHSMAYRVLIGGAICATLFVWLGLDKKAQPNRLINGLALTATDANETHARYSPSGQYIVFRRALDLCYGHLWAMDLASGDEYQLTKEKGVYGSVDWSASGDQLTFMSTNHCGEQPQQAMCWQLNTLDVGLAFSQPQSPTARIDCQAQPLAVARWMGNSQIAYLRETEQHGKQLESFDVINSDTRLRYVANNQTLYSFDYSHASNSFAVISRHESQANPLQHSVTRLNRRGEVLSSAEIQLEPHHSPYEYFNSYFSPTGDSLITYTDSGIHRLSFDGALTTIKTESMSRLSHPNYSPSGRHLIVTKRRYDTDIALVDMSQTEPLQVVARSNEAEYWARLSPNGQTMAFMSTRTGRRQLWYRQNEQIKQLSHQQQGVMLAGLVWSPGSDYLALVEQDKLVTYDLDGNRKEYDLGKPIDSVLQWRQDQILVLINQQLFYFDVRNSALTAAIHLTESADVAVQWGYDFAELGLMYMSDRTLFLRREGRTRALTRLTEQVRNNHWVISASNVYGIDTNNELWRYDVASHTLQQKLMTLPINGKLNQVHEQQLVMTFTLSERTELVEFELAE